MPAIDEWKIKMKYIYTVEYYTVIKNEIIKFTGKYLDNSRK